MIFLLLFALKFLLQTLTVTTIKIPVPVMLPLDHSLLPMTRNPCIISQTLRKEVANKEHNAVQWVRNPHLEGNPSYVSTLSCNGCGEDDATFYDKAVDNS